MDGVQVQVQTGHRAAQQPGQLTPARTGWRKYIHLDWMRMPMGLLKVVQFLIVLLALCIMGSVRAARGLSSIEFFFVVHSATLIMVGLNICLYVSDIFHTLPTIMICNMVWTILCAIGAFMHLVSSSVVMDMYRWNDVILAGGSFGIIASFLFVFEAVVYFIQWRNVGPYQTSGVSVIIPGAK